MLVDSDILIEVSRARNTTIVALWTDLSDSEHAVLCSPVSVAELWQGARAKEYEALEQLFNALRCVPLDREAGRLAGEYLRQYRKSHSLELGDALIGAAAILNGAKLWTLNRKHYPMKGLSFY